MTQCFQKLTGPVARDPENHEQHYKPVDKYIFTDACLTVLYQVFAHALRFLN